MNSEFNLINDDDISAFDIGTPAFLSSSWSSPTGEGLHPSKTDGQEFIVFIEPTISTYPIDPDSRQRLSDEIDKLFIESHYLTITSELVTPQLLKLERKKKELQKKREKENVQHIQDVSIPSAIEEKKPDKPSKKQNEAKKLLPLSNSATEKRKIRTIKKVKLVPVRLKSGEVLKATQDLLIHFRQKVAGSANPEKSQAGDINVFKIQPDALSRVIHVPFTDRLSPALKRLSAPKFTASTPLKLSNGHQSLKNGKVHKPLKLRAALDKSTIAWSSTTKTRPKASLLDQLNSLAKKPRHTVKTDFTEIRTEIPSVYKDTSLKNTTSPAQKPLNVVPVVIKLKKKAHSNKLLPLSQALKFIASDTLNLDAKMKNKMTNGDFSTPKT